MQDDDDYNVCLKLVSGTLNVGHYLNDDSDYLNNIRERYGNIINKEWYRWLENNIDFTFEKVCEPMEVVGFYGFVYYIRYAIWFTNNEDAILFKLLWWDKI